MALLGLGHMVPERAQSTRRYPVLVRVHVSIFGAENAPVYLVSLFVGIGWAGRVSIPVPCKVAVTSGVSVVRIYVLVFCGEGNGQIVFSFAPLIWRLQVLNRMKGGLLLVPRTTSCFCSTVFLCDNLSHETRGHAVSAAFGFGRDRPLHALYFTFRVPRLLPTLPRGRLLVAACLTPAMAASIPCRARVKTNDRRKFDCCST